MTNSFWCSHRAEIISDELSFFLTIKVLRVPGISWFMLGRWEVSVEKIWYLWNIRMRLKEDTLTGVKALLKEKSVHTRTHATGLALIGARRQVSS